LRLKGNEAYRCHDLYSAKNFYLQALSQLKKLLQITRVNPDWVNAEYARISANLSLLELTKGHLPEALAAAMESIRMNSTWAKVGILSLPEKNSCTYMYRKRGNFVVKIFVVKNFRGLQNFKCNLKI